MMVKISLIHAFHAIKPRNVGCRAVSCPVSLLCLSRVTTTTTLIYYYYITTSTLIFYYYYYYYSN